MPVTVNPVDTCDNVIALANEITEALSYHKSCEGGREGSER